MESYVFLVRPEKCLTQKLIFANVLLDYVGTALDVLMFLNVQMVKNGTYTPILVSVQLELNGMELIA